VESRITVALKEYYLTRAQSGADLPDWLFSAEERRAAGGIPNAAPSRAFRDDTPVAYARRPSLDERQRGYNGKEDLRTNEPSNSAVPSRFKQIRDAKRGVDASAKQHASRVALSEPMTRPPFRAAPAYDDSNVDNRRTPGPAVRARGIGVGLPSGPGGIRRPSPSRR
jgi:heme-degrading monooxygenase HmoA